MEEFKFVLKCFIFASLIVVFLQSKIQGETIENKASIFLAHSETADWIRAAAAGGVKLLEQGFATSKNFIEEKLGHNQTSSSHATYLRPVYSQRQPTAKAQQVEPTEPVKIENKTEASY